MIKKILILFLMVCSVTIAQVTKGDAEARKTASDLNCKVLGLVVNGNNYFLNTEKGLIQINNEEDPWEKYYQKIYNDTTIQNPNTEIKPAGDNSSVNFFNPAIDISQWAEKYNTFGNKLYLYDFMQIDENGNYVFKPGAIGLIEKEINK